jgi:hypothetical protein
LGHTDARIAIGLAFINQLEDMEGLIVIEKGDGILNNHPSAGWRDSR